MHVLHVVLPIDCGDVEADIVLDLLRYEDFSKALLTMGINKGDIDRLERESGGSPTILRFTQQSNAAVRSFRSSSGHRKKKASG